jgi:hypothetical protein
MVIRVSIEHDGHVEQAVCYGDMTEAEAERVMRVTASAALWETAKVMVARQQQAQ